MVVKYFQKDNPELAKDLSKVKRQMKKAVVLKNETVKKAIFDIFDAGGKMLRPAYLLLFSDFTDLKAEQRIALAAAVEMLHTATLIHDDIVDQADIRRDVETISHKYGADVAVYAGDYLFVSVFKILGQQSLELSNLTEQTSSIERLLGGELGQMSKRFDLTQTIEDYIENISGKTAELFALSCSIPAMIVGDKKLAKPAFEIGKNIGIAFQIMDDYLDYTSGSSEFGKPVLEDIKQGVYSAPVLYVLESDRAYVSKILEAKNFEAFNKFLAQSDALEKTKKLAESYTDKALDLMKKLPKTETTEKIIQITKKLLERKI